MESKRAGRIVVGQHERAVLTDSSGWNRTIGGVQTRQHVGLLRTGHQPDDAPRAIEHGIGQGHPAPALIRPGERDVGVGDVEHRIPGHQRRGMAVRPEAQVCEIEHRRSAGYLL